MYTSVPMLHDVEIIESEVLTILNSLEVNKAAGIDNIGPKVLSPLAGKGRKTGQGYLYELNKHSEIILKAMKKLQTLSYSA